MRMLECTANGQLERTASSKVQAGQPPSRPQDTQESITLHATTRLLARRAHSSLTEKIAMRHTARVMHLLAGMFSAEPHWTVGPKCT